MAGFIILGVKKNEHFSIDFNRKSEELSFNSKDNSLTFLCDKKKRGTFFQNLSLFDNWSCSTTQEILKKKFHLPVIKNGKII